MREALGARLRAVGRARLAGELRGEDVPVAARIAQLAEFVEVAHRVGGVEAAGRWRARARAGSSTPRWPRAVARDAEVIFAGLDAVAPGRR